MLGTLQRWVFIQYTCLKVVHLKLGVTVGQYLIPKPGKGVLLLSLDKSPVKNIGVSPGGRFCDHGISSFQNQMLKMGDIILKDKSMIYKYKTASVPPGDLGRDPPQPVCKARSSLLYLAINPPACLQNPGETLGEHAGAYSKIMHC